MRKTACLIFLLCVRSSMAQAETMTITTTLDRLLNETARGRILTGQRQVAQDKFSAQRIGYYLPEISFNTTLPSYRQSQQYENYYGFAQPILFKRSDISSYGNLQLKQKIITGGDLIFQAGYDLRDNEYPTSVMRAVPVEGFPDSVTFERDIATATDRRRLGNFSLQFSQPLFRSSDSRSAYLDARENLSEADIQWLASRTDLKREGITAYFDLLSAGTDLQIAESQSHLAEYTARWDSVKYVDSVITEVTWVESKSNRLEKKLSLFDAQATYEEKRNTFNHLLDYPTGSQISLDTPEIPALPDQQKMQGLLAESDKSTECELARIKMDRAERDLDKTRSSSGLNGTLNASYSIGRGNVKQSQPEFEYTDKINTDDWRVSIDFTYPIWDGGASGANVHSMELAYESSRLEYLAAQRNAENKMTILLKRLEINYSKLSLLAQELELADKKLRDAEKRFGEGMISDAALLENRTFFFEARKKQLATLKDYYLDLAELEKIELP